LKAATIGRYLVASSKAGPPVQAYWVANVACNLRCQSCNFWQGIYKKEGEEILSTEEARGLIDEISQWGIPSLVITGGEPFMRPDIREVLEYAVREIQYVRLQTNGTFLDEEMACFLVDKGLDEIWISVDGGRETHDRIRGVKGTYDKVVAGLENLVRAKEKAGSPYPVILINAVVSSENLYAVEEILDLAVRFKAGEALFNYVADVDGETIRATESILQKGEVFSEQFSTEGRLTTAEHRLSQETINRIRRTGEKEHMVTFIDPLLITGEDYRPIKGHCLMLWSNIMLSPYGEVIACQMLDRCVMGSIRERPLKEIWNGPEFEELRIKAREGFPICRECCVARTTLRAQLRDPANFKRVFLSRKARRLVYKSVYEHSGAKNEP
jgi:MoaA/NifB/PqqE/SkfB family radical SAM enzyme